jgi:ATP-dependent helicase/nuclease subunit A
VLGEAIHACIAADLATPGQPISMKEVQDILGRMGVDQGVGAALHGQLRAVREWLGARWPGARPIVELPMLRTLVNGQRVVGRTDLLLRTESGWILFDHKSTPQGSAQWSDLAATHAGQLAAYRDVIEAVSGVPIEEIWLVLPVAGAALRVDIAPLAVNEGG